MHRKQEIILTAKKVLKLEAKSILASAERLNEIFEKAVTAILESNGRVVLCGMGKSGHIANKICATLVSTGTPSMFMHPAEAFHGDLGMILPEDVFLAISNSGETDEVLKLLPFLNENGNTLISMTGNPRSTLAVCSDFHIDIGVEKEACPLNLAPTSSTTVTLAMGDAIAVALMQAKDFKPENFAKFHPGGSLGRKLLGTVGTFSQPAVTTTKHADFKTVLSNLACSKNGLVCVVDECLLLGVITDGDIRRCLSSNEISTIVGKNAKDIMSQNPTCVTYTTRCSDADALMQEKSINSLIVQGADGKYYIYQNLNRNF
jgi:arabinose-5-phosphate isomerase